MIKGMIKKAKEAAKRAWQKARDFYEDTDFGREVLQPAWKNTRKIIIGVAGVCAVAVALVILLALLMWLVELWWPLVFVEIAAIAFIVNVLFNYSDYRRKTKRRRGYY